MINMYIHLCSSLQIICISNFTVVHISPSFLTGVSTKHSGKSGWEASCPFLLLDTSTPIATLVWLLLSVKVESFTVKKSLFSTYHRLMSSSYIIGFMSPLHRGDILLFSHFSLPNRCCTLIRSMTPVYTGF